MRISDWSSDLCSSDLETTAATLAAAMDRELASPITVSPGADVLVPFVPGRRDERLLSGRDTATTAEGAIINDIRAGEAVSPLEEIGRANVELQSLMRISYAVFCLTNKTII